VSIISHKNFEAFSAYKNKYINKQCCIFGTGQSLLRYNIIPNTVNIGCNRCIFYKDLIFDFYFFNDLARTTAEYRNHILSYTPKIKKFFGSFINDKHLGCSKDFAESGNAILYDMEGPGGGTFQKEIDKYCVGDKGQSIVFVEMQFALFCGFTTIYIIGCDIDNLKNKDKYFYNADYIKNYTWYSPLKQNWIHIKNFISKNYPNVKIVSVNPMGLKNIFIDMYQ
jgi:hypothetical protein